MELYPGTLLTPNKIKELKQIYPQVYDNFFYDIKNGRRWSDL